MRLSSLIKLPVILLQISRCAAFLAGMFVCAYGAAEPLKVAIPGNSGDKNSDDPSHFFQQLLVLALEKTRLSDGEYVLLYNNHRGGIARDRAMVIADAGIDVVWASATKEREQQMRVVPVDILKNLNNFRVLLINKNAQSQFNHVKTLNDLRKFTVGSVEHWTDGTIMKDNGFNVVATSSYIGLFKMLAARRFNFLSRGLHEIGFETRAYKDYALVQEETLLLTYENPARYCYFVNKNNVALADRIERGLKIAQQDGSFDTLFNQMSSFKEGEEILKSSYRTLIQIKNSNN